MRVRTKYTRSVVFLSQLDGDGNQQPRATAFLLGTADTPDGRFGEPLPKKPDLIYLVTARHVVEAARSTGSPLFVRGNDVGGELMIEPTGDYDDWHCGATADVALLPLPERLKESSLAGSCIALDEFADATYLTVNDVGPGDEVFFVGLFTEHAGSRGNEPIVRFGNISMLPNEPVRLRNADGSHSVSQAFLVEARSWGGQSGSPAFVWLSPLREPGVITMAGLAGPPGTAPLPLAAVPRLLGVVCGHYDVRQDVAFEGDYEELGGSVRSNVGVAVVVPAGDIEAELGALRAG